MSNSQAESLSTAVNVPLNMIWRHVRNSETLYTGLDCGRGRLDEGKLETLVIQAFAMLRSQRRPSQPQKQPAGDGWLELLALSKGRT